MPVSRKLPDRWSHFVSQYSKDHAYWYQPKGLAVSPDDLWTRLEVLSELEGKAWRTSQSTYIKRLRAEGLSGAKALWSEGGAPLARMLKQVFVTLGLAWIDENDRIELSAAGRTFLNSSDDAASSLLRLQVLKYQFWNPAVGRHRPHGAVRLHPVPFLVRLLFALPDESLSNREYILFVAKAKRPNEVDRVLDDVLAFRELDGSTQESIVSRCQDHMIGGAKRKSIYDTISKNRSYAYRMWSLSGIVQKEGGAGLTLDRAKYKGVVRDFLERYVSESTYIDFASRMEFFAWMGDPESRPTRDGALDIYINRGDIEAAIRAKKELRFSQSEIRSFERMMISERTLEDNIEKNVSILNKALGYDISIVGRQYHTPVGPIDLLATESKSGRYVVIELKKGRSGDKVYGQLSRYMGWVRENLAQGAEVAGIVVGSKIDDKLRAAVAAHNTDVKLIEYTSRISAKMA